LRQPLRLGPRLLPAMLSLQKVHPRGCPTLFWKPEEIRNLTSGLASDASLRVLETRVTCRCFVYAPFRGKGEDSSGWLPCQRHHPLATRVEATALVQVTPDDFSASSAPSRGSRFRLLCESGPPYKGSGSVPPERTLRLGFLLVLQRFSP